jgi:poly-gamma-glutamate synthesis protein (capsule biosynthesis protein)
MRTPPETAHALRDAGFDVMSFAGNHCMDWGAQGLEDTLEAASEAGVALCGAGGDIEAARAPVFATCGDVRVAFLGFSSILPDGYWAEKHRPGCAPMRAHTHYEMIEPDQPGTLPRIHTHPHAGDLAALKSAVADAKARADIVAVSLHWGVHMVPVVIADYQHAIAHAAIEAGADLILGHHAHILKGVGFHCGAPIFYSLGNFAIEQPQAFDPGIRDTASFRHLMSLNPTADPNALYVLPPDTRMTLIVKIDIEKRRIARTRFIPAWIGDDSTPTPLHRWDHRFRRVANYIRRVSEEAGLALRVEADGDEVLLG